MVVGFLSACVLTVHLKCLLQDLQRKVPDMRCVEQQQRC